MKVKTSRLALCIEVIKVPTVYGFKNLLIEEKGKVVAPFGGRIYPIPCRASYFAQSDFEE